MKPFRTLTAFILGLFVSINCFGQEHLSFKGIPINGTLTEFTKALTLKGFTVSPKQTNPSIKELKGDFMGRNSEIWVVSSKEGLVWKVVVWQEYYTWTSLKSAYNSAVELYSKKYGTTKDDFRFFSKPYYEGDGYELQAIRNDSCHYASFWELSEGMISVRIDSIGSNYYIVITYEDDINFNIKNRNDEERALNDI